jgi:general stress protein YciG
MANSGKSNRGFASMDPEKQRQIASKGGQSVPPEERSFSKDPALAASAGRKGGQASHGARSQGMNSSAGNSGGSGGAQSGGHGAQSSAHGTHDSSGQSGGGRGYAQDPGKAAEAGRKGAQRGHGGGDRPHGER